MEPVVLRTERLVLSVPRPADIDTITALCQDRAMIERLAALPWPYTRADAEHFVNVLVPQGWASGDSLTWAIREHEDGPLLGSIAWRRSTHDIGFWMGAPHRGRGVTTEAAREVCRYVFAELGEERIGWEAHVGNTASARIARTLGFTFEGERASVMCERDGVQPAAWHATLARDADGSPQPGWPL